MNQPLVLVEGVRHSDVGHFGSSPDSVMRCTFIHREFAVWLPVWVWADRMEQWPWWCFDWSQSRVRCLGQTWRLRLWFRPVFSRCLDEFVHSFWRRNGL